LEEVEMADHKDSKAITEEEAQLYDRQIRLWGLDAQKRLRAARILLAGMRGLGCEVAKNLVLAGVNSMTVMDHEPLTKEDFDSQFLAPRDKLGANRAEASLERLQALNPQVEITVDKSPLEAKGKEFFAGNFDVVIVTNATRDVMVSVNKLCRDCGDIKFFAGDIFGFFGYCFLDLVKHEYVEEVKANPAEKKEEESGEPDAKKAKTSSDAGDEPETKMVKNTMEFVSLEKALAADWTSLPKSRFKRMDASAYFLLMTIFEFQSREGVSHPRASNKAGDLETLGRLRADVVSKYELPPTVKITDEAQAANYLEIVFSELSPVAAIVGGVLAQEVIKTVSKKDQPQNNFFLYNPIESSGSVEAVGY